MFREWLQVHYPDRAEHVMNLIQQSRDGKDYQSGYFQRMTGQGIFADAAADIAGKAVSLALAGDTTMLRLLLDKTVPGRKDSPVHLDLPEINALSDLPRITGAIMKATTKGKITPVEAHGLTKIIEAHIKATELAEIDARLRILEGEK